ncbi:MAG: hypothetical protein IPJ32_18590 [Sphingobacteriaceae bacterium]|nr:hypothetical protein [Sphingobacteriaceae bacterium]
MMAHIAPEQLLNIRVNISPGYTLNFPGGSYWYGNFVVVVCRKYYRASSSKYSVYSSSGTYYFDAYFTNGCLCNSEYGGNCESLFLPIELLDFNTNCYNNAIEVNWETATERDNKHFYDFTFGRAAFSFK